MAAEQLVAWVMQALELALWLSLPALGASLLVSAIIAVSLALFASASWMGDRLIAFAAGVLRGLPQ